MVSAHEGVVLFEIEQGVACITLNRPDRLNASNAQLSRALNEAFTEAARDGEARVVLLRGAGRGFCAGADMEVLGEIAGAPGEANSGTPGLRYDGLMQMAKPVIAAVHGPAAGIGLALACSADVRIAARSAFFLAPFAKLGLCAEGGLAWLLARAMGPGNAAEMLFSARRVGAEEAYAKGLVSHVFDDEVFERAAFDYAAQIARNAPSSFAMMKGQLWRAGSQTYAQQREEARQLTEDTLRSADFGEAMAATRENRDPDFTPVSVEFEPPIFRES